jgi:hypothetical protein
MAHQKPLVFIGEELSIGKVTAIRNNGVDLTKDGKSVSATFAEVESSIFEKEGKKS